MSDFQLYFQLGLHHILSIGALDHILFLMALILIFSLQEWRKLLGLVSLFTIAHTGSLLLSVYGIIQVNGDLIENLILISILITAGSNIIVKNKKIVHQAHYYFSFLFGLIHGLGFANDFKIIIDGEVNKLFPLLSFALGIELAQIFLGLLILLFVGLLHNLFHFNKREIVLLISAGIIGFTISLF